MRRRQLLYGSLAVITVILTVTCLANALLVQTKLEESRQTCEEAIHLFLKGSDTLTNEVFAYGDTAQLVHLTNYWTEAEVTRCRDVALERLEGISLSQAEKDALRQASNASNDLMDLETHAMRLIALSAGVPAAETPRAVAEYRLPAEETYLMAPIKRAKARTLLFGREYMNQKNVIIRGVADFSYHLNSRIGKSVTDNMHGAWLAISVNLVLFIIFIVLYQVVGHQNDAAAREELRKREECFRVVAKQTGHYVFRYDIPTRTYYHITGGEGIIPVPEVVENLADSAVTHSIVAQESMEAYRGFLAVLDEGKTPPDTDVRLLEKNGEAKWYRFSATLVHGDDGAATSAVVSYADCAKQREQELAYSRWMQEMRALDAENVVLHEWNITRDILENEHGVMEPAGDHPHTPRFDERARIYGKLFVAKEDQGAFRSYVNREKLIGMYHNGVFSDILDYREIQPDRTLRWTRLTIRLVMYPSSSDIKAYVMKQDIDEEKRMELALIQQSELDSLTGALNRRAFIAKVTELLQKAPKQNHVLMMLDIDGFKSVNDTYGHDFGDKFLQNFTEAARRQLRPHDLVGRIGGDEFMICIPDVPTDSAITKKANQVIQTLHTNTGDGQIVTVSMGIAVYSRDGTTFEELYQKADIALYKMKKSGKDSFCFYLQGMENGGNMLTSFDS